jgi:pyruvate carboxylase
MKRALKEYKIGGLVTNLPLLVRMLEHEDYVNYSYDLKFGA